MGLLELPPEILDEIISLTPPHGFESFVLSCKTVYVRAGSQIKRHNAFRKVQQFARDPATDRGKALRLLYEISREPLVEQYIEVLNLGITGIDSGASDNTELDEFRIEEEIMQSVKRTATQSEWMERAGVDVDDWWGTMMREDEESDEEEYSPYTIISLLGTLTKLKSLQLPQSWRNFRPSESDEDDKRLAYVLDALISFSNTSTNTNRPLAKLQTILPFMPRGYNQRAGLQCQQPFFTLDGLTELYAVSCLAVDDYHTGIPFKWNHIADTSLKRVELVSCCIDGDGISALLAHTPQLEVFRYSHETKWHGCQHDWNPGAFVVALSRYCASTLTELALTIDELFGDIINGTSTFLALTKLRTLEADLQVFCGPPVESGQTMGLSGSIPTGDRPWTAEDIPCIGSMLPPSIEECAINTDGPEPDGIALQALLKNIKDQRAQRLKQLHTVIIRQYNGSTAQEIVDEAECSLVVFGVGPHARPRSMMPQWKRDFEQRVGGIDIGD